MTTDNLPAARHPVTMDLTGPLTDMQQALELADTLSRSELVPRALQGRSANVFHVLMTGQALGLHWTESLRVIYSAGPGQIGLRGGFLLSQLRKAGHKYTITEEPDSATFKLVRGDTDEKFESTFTVEDAIRGGLLKRNQAGELTALSRDGKPLPWQAWTKRMLRWRAVSDCVGFAAPEVALGFEIEGAEPAPEPEVILKPQTPAPPAPDGPREGQAVQAQVQSQLAGLDQQARSAWMPATDAEADAMAAGSPAEPEVGGNPGGTSSAAPDVGGNPAGTPEPVLDAGDRAELERGLAEQFAKLGWDPKKHRVSMLRACTMFARRRIKSVRDLTPVEIYRLHTRLVTLEAAHHPDHQVVALSDLVEEWRERFAESDPDGYEKVEK